jgi:predicted phage terminase large subunit-like protein
MAINTKDTKAIERYRLLLKAIAESNTVNPFESQTEQQQRIALAKKDYNYFVNTYFSRYASSPCADFHLALAKKVRANKRCKLLLGWGRGLAKSTHVDILIPLWLWINNDMKVMVLIGQTQDKANTLLGDLQAEFEANQLLIHDFGQQQSIGSWETGKFITKNDCAFFALGFGQSVRGLRHRQHRPDYASGDDLDTREICKNPKRLREAVRWVSGDLLGALDAKASRYLHVNNIFAPKTILTELRDLKEGYDFIQVNAQDEAGNPTWKQNEHLATFYEDQKKAMGILDFNAEYNNIPFVEGTIFNEAMIQWTNVPRIDRYDSIVAYWDIAYSEASTADYNAIKIWGLKDGKFYLIRAFVKQCKMAVAIRWANAFMEYIPKTLLGGMPRVTINWYFESQFWNDAVTDTIKQVSTEFDNPINWIRAERPKGNKYDRIMNTLPYYQQGIVYYNNNFKSNSDMQVGIVQLFGIEPGYKTHDDSPDADAAALELLSKRKKSTTATYRTGSRENFKF